jgi:hypothetical protein
MVNTKVSLDELIYHLAKFHIFLRLLTSFPELFLFCAIGKEETNFGNPISFPYRAGPTNHQPVYPQPAKAFGPTRQPPPSLCRPHTSGGNFPNLIAHCPLLCLPLRQRRFWPRPTTMTSGQAAVASSPRCTTWGPSLVHAACFRSLAACRPQHPHCAACHHRCRHDAGTRHLPTRSCQHRRLPPASHACVAL